MSVDAPNPLTKRAVEASLRDLLSRVSAQPPEALAGILAASLEPLVAFTAERVILTANAAAEHLFGYEKGALAGRSTDVLVPERLRQPNAPPMAVFADLMSVDLAGVLHDGSELPLEWTFGSALGGPAPVFVMLVRNRAQLDEANEALRISEERFRHLVDGVRDHAIFMLDARGFVSTWNPGAERIKGWTAEEIIGKHYEVFFSKEAVADGLPTRLLEKSTEDGNAEAGGWRVRKDGSAFFAQSSISNLRKRDGTVRGYAVITQDLTTRMHAEETERRLHEEQVARQAAEAAEARALVSEERLRRLYWMTTTLANATKPEEVGAIALRESIKEVGASAGGVYALEADGRTLGLIASFGIEAAVLEPFRRIPLDLPTPLTDAARAGVAAFWETREAWLQRYPELRDSLRNDRFDASVALPLMSHGRLVGVFGIQFDTARHFEEEEKSLLLTIAELCSQALQRAHLFAAEQRAREDAESASRAKDEFLAMLGHELRNPLAPISSALQLMRSRSEGPDRERDIIERQVRHMTKLVDDLLDVARIARGTLELAREDTSMVDVVERAAEMASPLLVQRKHTLKVSVPPEGTYVNGDPPRLAQVVANLLNNAAKYTPASGHIDLSVAIEGTEVVVRVKDDGEGMSPELIDRIFDIFVQGQRTLARSEGGLGLGLALVRNIVVMHGGSVTAASEGLGLGSELTVRLPAVTPGTQRPPAIVPSAQALPSSVRRVLVVDDNEDAAELLALGLERQGYEVQTAFDGLSALERLRTFRAEVAILDLGLPDIDGFELARRIRFEHADRVTRLVALTGYGRDVDIAKSAAAGFDAHLTKPVHVATVVSAIEER